MADGSSTTGAAPDASPTALILSYLQSKGLPPTSANVSQALQLNASNPGVIPGLVNQAPPPPDPQPAPTRSPVPSAPQPPMPPQTGPQPGPNPGPHGEPPTQPDQNPGLGARLWEAILGGGAATAAANMRPGVRPAPSGGSGSGGIPNEANSAAPMGSPAPLEGEVLPPAPRTQIGAPPPPPTINEQATDNRLTVSPGEGGDMTQLQRMLPPDEYAALIAQSAAPKAIGVTPPALGPDGKPLLAVGNSPSIRMPDATSGKTIIPPNTTSGPTISMLPSNSMRSMIGEGPNGGINQILRAIGPSLKRLRP